MRTNFILKTQLFQKIHDFPVSTFSLSILERPFWYPENADVVQLQGA